MRRGRFGHRRAGEYSAGEPRSKMSLGAPIGAITFTGSIIAFLKLSARMSGAPIMLPMRHAINLALFVAIVLITIWFVRTESYFAFWLLDAGGLPVRRADHHPDRRRRHAGRDLDAQLVFGLGRAGIGFTLGNSALIITGALVGSSGAILSYIMCKGMNRNFISVILGGFGGEVAGPGGRRRAAAGEARLGRGRGLHHEERLEGDHRAGLRHGGRAGAARAA
jgi:NAD(P) transhydrogenase subunit beta